MSKWSVARMAVAALLLMGLTPSCNDRPPPPPAQQRPGGPPPNPPSIPFGDRSPLAALSNPPRAANLSAAYWRSLSRRIGVVTMRGAAGGDVLLAYDEVTGQFVRISDELAGLRLAAIVAGTAPSVLYLRAPSQGIVVGRIDLASGRHDEIELGRADQVDVGVLPADSEPRDDGAVWIARRQAARTSVGIAQWEDHKLVPPTDPMRKALATSAPLWSVADGALDVVATAQRGGGHLADIDVDWDQWGTASALRLRNLARVLPMDRFADLRGMAWSPNQRWLLFAQWTDEICGANPAVGVFIFDSMTETTIELGALAPAGGFGWLGNDTLLVESSLGGRILQLAPGIQSDGQPTAPRELGTWPALRWPVRWRAADCRLPPPVS